MDAFGERARAFALCPRCQTETAISKRTAFKARCTTGGVLGGAISGGTAGAIYGTGTGIASGGTAMAGTVPLGIAGGLIGGAVLGTAAKAGADWAVARVKCGSESCATVFRV